jgi:hypothetical protein
MASSEGSSQEIDIEMKRIITGVLASLFVFLIARSLAYLLGLDELARNLARDVLQVPASELYLAAWLVSGVAGIVALVLWLVLNADERLSNVLSPCPLLGSLQVAGEPVFKIEVNRTTGKNTAELVVDLVNKNDHLVATAYLLRATANGKDLDRPVTGESLVSFEQKMRLFVRIDDIPMHQDLLAFLEYDVTYFFKGSRKTRRTAKGIEWKSYIPRGEPGAHGSTVVKPITVRYYKEVEE